VEYASSFTTGDIVGVVVDMDEGTISFSVNGQDQVRAAVVMAVWLVATGYVALFHGEVHFNISTCPIRELRSMRVSLVVFLSRPCVVVAPSMVRHIESVWWNRVSLSILTWPHRTCQHLRMFRSALHLQPDVRCPLRQACEAE